MASLRVLRKALFGRFWQPVLIGVPLILGVSSTLIGCSSGNSEKDYDPDYHQNLFYLSTDEAPSHEKKAHLDFFNKECTSSGSGSFSCHYTDQ